ncbi:hypothetical protein [Ralstonia pseudosolanacearum]|uniref:hypothetical protein n=1 Tax=Ralstonia pseudosolanacearum TaxID=1310165 RepID=UPI00201E08B1|nr:hypothetical protein [Ralstonia pseudosolanacearum]UQY83671.1 hypothetical protein JNO62_06005 [Ralstonia pseudosolanacearum]
MTILNTIAEAVLPTPERLQAAVTRLDAQLTEAEGELSRRRSEHETLLADAALDDRPLDGSAIKKARDDAALAAERITALRAALATAKARLTAAQQQETRAQLAKRWDAAIAQAERRSKHLTKLEASMAAFAADYTEALKLTDDLRAALPANPDPIGAMVDRMAFETALRKELHRLGLAWAFQWPYGAVSLPEFMPQFLGAVEVVRAWRPTKD